ncbi:hypothetical protein PV328_003384 [Microctonus aethiopoides]|uniref:Alpha-and gamma-adaptin-binding protein p34 n=1 Tax=Microctonus aethiopoides TaxID=144406 RepID=A0AA39F8C1_9HYME|nr:hypothetical protein PV328_003384 [Microctonus aethiopoides]
MQLLNMEVPCVLILSTESGKARTLAQDMDAKFVTNGKKDAKYFAWDIDNKYYSAQVMIYAIDNLEIPLEINIDRIEAVVLHYTPKEKELLILDEYLPLIQSLTDADVFLLACEAFPDANNRDNTLEWCHVHKFELIDMGPLESIDLAEEMEQEKHGIERIIEALHTHSWPNRILKGLPNGRISTSNESDVTKIEDQLESIRLGSSRSGTEHLLMDSVLDGIMGEENADFGELFSQLIAMKEHAASLSPSSRRTAAEQLVTAFWKSLGGDSSEIADLDE